MTRQTLFAILGVAIFGALVLGSLNDRSESMLAQSSRSAPRSAPATFAYERCYHSGDGARGEIKGPADKGGGVLLLRSNYPSFHGSISLLENGNYSPPEQNPYDPNTSIPGSERTMGSYGTFTFRAGGASQSGSYKMLRDFRNSYLSAILDADGSLVEPGPVKHNLTEYFCKKEFATGVFPAFASSYPSGVNAVGTAGDTSGTLGIDYLSMALTSGHNNFSISVNGYVPRGGKGKAAWAQ